MKPEVWIFKYFYVKLLCNMLKIKLYAHLQDCSISIYIKCKYIGGKFSNIFI